MSQKPQSVLRRNRRSGFSLVEVVFSIAVLSVVLLGSIASVHYGYQSQIHGKVESDGAAYASRLMELMLEQNLAFTYAALPPASSGFNDVASDRRNLNDAPFSSTFYNLGEPNAARFRRNITVNSTRSSSESGSTYGWKDDLRQVTVTVYWTEGKSLSGAPVERSVTLKCFSKLPR